MYPMYTRKIKIKEQNPLLGSFVDRKYDNKPKPWQDKLFGYTLVTEQKVLYILIAHLLIIYVSVYACPFLCLFLGWYTFFAFVNTVMFIAAVKQVRAAKKCEDTCMALAEAFETMLEDNSDNGYVSPAESVKNERELPTTCRLRR